MAAPTYSAGTPGNVLSRFLPAGQNAAALVDLSTVLGGALHCKMATGTTAPSAATTFAMNRVSAATAIAPNTTLSAAVAAGATSLSVNSILGIAAGEKVALLAATTGIGEVVNVASATGTTLTLAGGTINGYSVGDLIFHIEQTASGGSVAPGYGWAPNMTYSTSIYPPAAWVWVIYVSNADTAQPVNVSVTLDKNPTFA